MNISTRWSLESVGVSINIYHQTMSNLTWRFYKYLLLDDASVNVCALEHSQTFITR